MSDNEAEAKRPGRAKREDAIATAREMRSDAPSMDLAPAKAKPQSDQFEIRQRPDGSVEVLYEGEVFSRGANDSDPFNFDLNIIPRGWSYEWKTMKVMGQANPTREAEYARNGWRHVEYQTHPGIFGPSNMTGPIITKDLALMRRPQILTDEARAEERRKAKQLDMDKRRTFEANAAYGFEGKPALQSVKPVINSSIQPVPQQMEIVPRGTRTFPVE